MPARASVPLLCLPVYLLCASLAAAPEPSTALAALTGQWQGELEYLDYQSGERYAIPLRVTARSTPDGATLMRELVFTDPGVEVHAVSLTTSS